MNRKTEKRNAMRRVIAVLMSMLMLFQSGSVFADDSSLAEPEMETITEYDAITEEEQRESIPETPEEVVMPSENKDEPNNDSEADADPNGDAVAEEQSMEENGTPDVTEMEAEKPEESEETPDEAETVPSVPVRPSTTSWAACFLSLPSPA